MKPDDAEPFRDALRRFHALYGPPTEGMLKPDWWANDTQSGEFVVRMAPQGWTEKDDEAFQRAVRGQR